MSNVLQILSSNYSGKSVNITFTSLKGDIQKFDNVSLPYNFINDTFDGNYTLFFPEYNLTHKFEIPTPPSPPVSLRCRCTEFNCRSFLNEKCTISFTGCDGTFRTITMAPNTARRDCIKTKSEKISKNATSTYFGYCNTVRDCSQLTQPPTPTPTKTPASTPTQTPTNTQTPTVTQTPTLTKTPTNTTTKTQTPTNTLTQTPTPTNTVTSTSTLTPTVTQTNTPTNTLTPTVTASVTQTNTPTTTQTPTITPYTNCLMLGLVSDTFAFDDPGQPGNGLPSGVYLYNNSTNEVISSIILNGFDSNLITRYYAGNSILSGSTGLAHYYDVNSESGMMWIKNFGDVLYEFTLGSNYEATLINTYNNCPGNRLALKDNTTLITTTGTSTTTTIVEIDLSGPSPVLTPKFSLNVDPVFISERYLGAIVYNRFNKLIFMYPRTRIVQFDYSSGNLEYLSEDLTIDDPAALYISNGVFIAIWWHARLVIPPQTGTVILAATYYGCSGGRGGMWGTGCYPGSVSSGNTQYLISVSNNSINCNDISFPPNVNLSPTPTQTNTPTPTITPSVTQTNTPTQSFTPSVTQTNTPTITQTITPTSLCRCTTITNLESSANTISYYFCGFAQGEPILIEDTLEANQEIRICVTNDSVVGENILVSYDGGSCQQVDNTRVCPELPVSPTPTMTPTITQTVTPSSPVNQNIIIVSGTKNFPGETTQQGLFKYDYNLNTVTYLGISGNYAGVSHTYNFQTQTGKIWASNGGVIQEYNILNSNLDNELNRTITLTGSGYGRNLTFKNETTLIKTILVNGERWVAEIDITETNVNPITTLKFRITNTDSNDDTFTTDLMYTNTGKFIWTNRFPNVVLQQYDYETGALEFESPVSFQPASLFQINSQIISIQTAPVRVVYDLITADDTLICPNILCGPTTGPTPLPVCVVPGCSDYFQSNGASSLLINNSVNFVPNQVCPIVDDFIVSQDFDTVSIQNNTEYDLNVFTKTSTNLIGVVLSGQLGEFPSTSFEESIVGVVPTYLEYFSTCRVCRDVFNAEVYCNTGCGSLEGLQMSKTNNGLTLSVLNTSPSYLLFYDSVGSNQQLFEVGAYNGSMNYPTMFFIYDIIVVVTLRNDGTVCNTCFSLDTLLEIPCP
jgi:hypothetical protein